MEILALSNFLVTPYGALLESTELNFRNLYMHQILDVNQAKIVDSNAQVGMGETAVNNWAIYDGKGSKAKRVASAMGMHMLSNHWYCSLVIVFDGEKFNGSSLQVMGVDVSDGISEWGIIGGTGEFAMARGVIRREFDRNISGGKSQKLTIHAFCVPRSFSDPEQNKDGPWGGEGDNEGDYEEGQEPRRLLSVTIHSGFVVDALEFEYVDQTGQNRTYGPWGGVGGHKNTITLGASDFIKKISGTTDMINGRKVVTSLLLLGNNDKTYGPYGKAQGAAFTSDRVPKTGYITGFFGTSSRYLDSIGVYYA